MADVYTELNVDTDLTEAEHAEIDIVVHNETSAVHRKKVSVAGKRLREDELVLDLGAEISVYSSRNLLRGDLYEAEPIYIDGVNSSQESLLTNMKGKTAFKHDAYYTDSAAGNLLSFAECVDNCSSVQYDSRKDRFYIEVDRGGESYQFDRKGNSNLYTCSHKEAHRAAYSSAIRTVAENIKKYSRVELRQAELARQYMRRPGVITAGSLIKLLAAGKIKHAEISVQDVVRAVDIWGKDLANLKGKTTAKTLAREREIEAPVEALIRQDQTLFIDIMFINKRLYLVGICHPSNHVMVKRLVAKDTRTVAKALKGMLVYMESTGCKVAEIQCDKESAIETGSIQELIGLAPNTSSDSIKVVERLIRTIKERIRGLLNTLPYECPDTVLDYMVYNIVYYLNLVPTSTCTDMRSARERLTGRIMDAKTDLRYGFGEYVQTIDNSTDNSMRERTKGGIALLPTGNKDGSWHFMLLQTWEPAKRLRAESMPMPDTVVDYISAKGAADRLKRNKNSTGRNDNIKIGLWRGARVTFDDAEEDDTGGAEAAVDDAADVPDHLQERMIAAHGDEEQDIIRDQDDQEAREVDETIEEAQRQQEYIIDNIESASPEQAAGRYDDAQDQDITGEDPADDSIGDDIQDHDPSEDADQGSTPDEEQQNTAPGSDIQAETSEEANTGRYGLRPNRSQPGRWAAGTRAKSMAAMEVNYARKHGLKMTIRRAKKLLGKQAIVSVVKEMIQLHSMKTWTGVHVRDITTKEAQRIISSSMFLKDKYTAEGFFDKLKARLVAGGHLQDKQIYETVTSPTVSTTSVFMIAAIAGAEGRAVATIDFPGAFLHSEMPDDQPPVHMRLNRFETKVLVTIDPSYKEFVQDNGTCVVVLKRALYGCVQSAKLWYDKISGELIGMGYKVNKQDMCVLNRKEEDGSQSTLCIHVDDMMITAKSEDQVDKIIAQIGAIYDNLSVHRGRRLDYLGMTFDFGVPDKCKVTMDGYVGDLLEFCGEITGVSKTPAGDNLFKSDETSEALDDQQREFFHSLTAKLLYLGKRVRPDILTAIAFLTKRVQRPTKEDMEKLERTVRYIRGTKELGIILQADKHIGVCGYIDASYGVHSDMKSHTGTVIGIGKGPIFTKSATQKINTKSSCEAELVGLSDSTGYIIWVRNFLLEQGYEVAPATVYQDNTHRLFL